MKRLAEKRSISCFKKGPYETLARRISLVRIPQPVFCLKIRPRGTLRSAVYKLSQCAVSSKQDQHNRAREESLRLHLLAADALDHR